MLKLKENHIDPFPLDKNTEYQKPDPNDMFFHLISNNEGWFEGKYQDHTIRLDFDDEDERNMWLLRSPVPPREF